MLSADLRVVTGLLNRVLLPLVTALLVADVQANDQSSTQSSLQASASAKAPGVQKTALTVQAVAPQKEVWPQLVPAAGEVVAWQESVIGSEIAGQRIVAVNAQVGDRVRKGQVLARIADDTANAELAQAKASLAEAEAVSMEAQANAERAKNLREKGFYSPQQGVQYETALMTAQARRASAQAAVQAAAVRLAQTRVLAPDDGIISARSATVGSLTVPGQELFRLIRQGRLEWRAEVFEAQSGLLKPGMTARMKTIAGAPLSGRVRTVSPSVDPKTRNAMAYVDITKPGDEVRAGMFVRGDIEVSNAEVLTLPQTAVLLRDGFAYVYVLEKVSSGGTAQVRLTKLGLGQRQAERVAVTAGLSPDARVVAAGAGFLTDGDLVRVEATR